MKKLNTLIATLKMHRKSLDDKHDKFIESKAMMHLANMSNNIEYMKYHVKSIKQLYSEIHDVLGPLFEFEYGIAFECGVLMLSITHVKVYADINAFIPLIEKGNKISLKDIQNIDLHGK